MIKSNLSLSSALSLAALAHREPRVEASNPALHPHSSQGKCTFKTAAAGLGQRRCRRAATWGPRSTAAPPCPASPMGSLLYKVDPGAFLWADVSSGAQVCPHLSSLSSELSFAPEPKARFTGLSDTVQKWILQRTRWKAADVGVSSPTTGGRRRESLNGDSMSTAKNGNLKSSYRKVITFSTYLPLWTKVIPTPTLSQTGECASVISCSYFISDFLCVDSLSVTSINETGGASSGLCLLCLLSKTKTSFLLGEEKLSEKKNSKYKRILARDNKNAESKSTEEFSL